MIREKKQLLTPPGWPLLLAGGIFGLVAGAFSLSESLEKATAVGIALFLGIALGGWMGVTAVKGLSSVLFKVYKTSDADLEQAISALKQRFADAMTSMNADGGLRPSAEESSNDAVIKVGSSFKALIELLRISSYIYPIAAVIVSAEFLTIVLLTVGGVDIPATISLFTLGSRALCGAMFAIYLLAFIHGLQLIRGTRKLINEIYSIEQLVATRRDGNIEKIIPDMSSMEKAVNVPPLVLARLGG